MKYVQYQVHSLICHMTRGVYIVVVSRESDSYQRSRNKRLEKYVNINTSPRFLVNIIWKVLSIKVHHCSMS